MSTFRKNFNLGTIKEVGEDDVLINVNGEDIEFNLDNNNRQEIFNAVEEGLYIVPVDLENKELLMTVDTKTLYEVFPETELEELKGADKELEENE